MTRSFLTVEDVNTVAFSNQGFYWHEINTANISNNSDFDYTKYDFVEVKRETQSSGSWDYKFTFKIDNPKFSKGVYVDLASGQSSVSTDSSGKVYISTNSGTVRILLYMGNISFSGIAVHIMDYYLENERISLNLKELNTQQTVYMIHRRSGNRLSVQKLLTTGYNLIENYGIQFGYLMVNLLKTDFAFNCTQSLIVGKVNKIYLGTDTDYLPDGDLVGTYTPKITVTYKGETLPVMYDETDYYFNLDLTDKTEAGKVRFKVNVEANEVLNSTTTEVALNSQYQTVNTFDAFLTAIANNDVIRLGANLTATSTIPVNRSVKIIGNDKTLDLNGYGFQLKEDVEFKAENIQLNNGDTTILQRPNTIVDLTNVTFTNCTSNNYNSLGGCIFCDTDYNSLNITDDYITNLTNCTFINNNTPIFHGGQLTMDKCRFHNNNTSYADVNNAGFLYQVDGDARISNCVFDIDYDTDQYCSGEENIDYAQALFMCGETATINGYGYTDLTGNNLNGFFDAPQNNRSHIFAKYYYPQISTCVFTSPISNNEDKCLCYGLSGEDYIYKINAQVTRADSGNENTTRKIGW